eukprot:364615-Chlamydomonas_euryale.AAC.29
MATKAWPHKYGYGSKIIVDDLVHACRPARQVSLTNTHVPSAAFFHVCCSCNPGIGDEGVRELAPLIESNQTLEALVLKECGLSRTGGLRQMGLWLKCLFTSTPVPATHAGVVVQAQGRWQVIQRSRNVPCCSQNSMNTWTIMAKLDNLRYEATHPACAAHLRSPFFQIITSFAPYQCACLTLAVTCLTGGELLLKVLLASKLLHLDLRENKHLKRHHWDGMVDPASTIGTVVSLDQVCWHPATCTVTSPPAHPFCNARSDFVLDDSQRDKSQPSTPCWIPREAHVTNILRKQQSGKSARSRHTSFAPGAAGNAAGSDDDNEGTGAGRSGSGQMNGLESLEGMPMAAASLMLNSAIGSTSGTARTFSRHKLTVGMLQDGVLERHMSQDGHLRTPAPGKKSLGGGLWGKRGATVAGIPTKLPRIPGVTFAGGMPADPPRSRTLPGIFSRA